MTKRLMTIPEFCAAYSVCRTTAYGLIAEGKIERVRIGRAARITIESAEAWFASLRGPDELHGGTD